MIELVRKLKQTVIQLARLDNKLQTLKHEVSANNYNIQKLLAENNWSNYFNSAIQGCLWFNNIPLNVGRWAGNYSFFYILFRILNDVKPQNILELGLGESTKMLQAYKMNYQPESTCVSVEHSKEWIEIKKQTGISGDFINILQVDLVDEYINRFKTLKYLNLADRLSESDKKFNLIIVDGPFGSQNFSRYNIIDIVKAGLLADDFIIIMDDAERKGEQDTIIELKIVLKEKNIKYCLGTYAGEKEQVLFASENMRYLTSL